MSIRFIAIGKLAADSLLISHSQEPKYTSGFLNESSMVFKGLEPLNLRSEERQKIKTANGEWFCQISQNQVVYAVLCTDKYPERHAYGLIQEAQIEFEKMPDQEQINSSSSSSQLKSLKRTLEKLTKKYSDLKSLDKIYAANEKAEDLKKQMGKNIAAQAANNADLERTLETSGKLKDLSHEFLQNSDKMRKIQQRRLLTIKIVISVLILAAIGVGIWLLLPEKSSN